jgi:serine protease
MQSARIGAGLPLLTPKQVLGILKSTARAPKVAPAKAKTFGAGILDAGAAVAAAATYGIDVPPPVGDKATLLTNRVMLTGQSGSAGSAVYKLDVPTGALALTLRTLQGNGNLSVYVKVGSAGSATNYDFKSASSAGTTKSVAISRPRAATYYVTVVGDSAYSGVTILGTFTVPK